MVRVRKISEFSHLTPLFFSDNLRDHYAECAQRGDRKIPETGQRGRRRHACLSVSNHCARDLLTLLILFFFILSAPP